MRTAAVTAVLPLLAAGAIVPAATRLAPAAPALAAGAIPPARQVPLAFEPNRGQAEHGARFVARLGSSSIALTDAGATFTLRPPSPARAFSRLRAGPDPQPVPGVAAPEAVLTLQPAGANPHPRIRGEGRLSGMVNYLLGRSPRGWHTGIPTYAQVRYAAVYPGVDLIFRGNGGRLEYDFLVSPGADPARIRLSISRAVPALDRAGDLLLRTAAGMLRQQHPSIYQQVGDRRRPVAGGFQVLPGRRIGFRLGAYDHRIPLVIDPLVVYATEFGAQGGGGDDEANGLGVDAAGDAYVVRTTTSGLSHKAIFVTKYDPTGARPLYTTLLSGDCDALGGDIAVDRTGDAYVTGLYTSKDANGICVVVQAVAAKLGPAGAPIYNVRFGGHQDFQTKDWGNGIAVDQAGNAYVAGETDNDPRFPTTPGALRSTPNAVGVDGFVLKIDPSGKLVYSTYLGGSDLDHAVGRRAPPCCTRRTWAAAAPISEWPLPWTPRAMPMRPAQRPPRTSLPPPAPTAPGAVRMDTAAWRRGIRTSAAAAVPAPSMTMRSSPRSILLWPASAASSTPHTWAARWATKDGRSPWMAPTVSPWPGQRARSTSPSRRRSSRRGAPRATPSIPTRMPSCPRST
jgi:hypothetical protein